MVAVSDLLEVSVIVVTFATAAGVLVSNPRRPANIAFSTFLALVGLNFLAGQLTNHAAPGTSAHLAWQRVALVTLALDPVALLYFTSVFPRRTRLSRVPVFLGLYAISGFLIGLVLTDRITLEYGLSAARALLFGFMAMLYSAALLGLLVTASHETSPVWRAQSLALSAGLGAALLPRLGLIPIELDVVRGDSPAGWWTGTAVVVFAAVAIYAAARALRADPPGLKRPAILAFGLASIFVLGWILAALVQTGGSRPLFMQAYLGKYQYSLRWILFAFIVGVAILRFQVVRFDNRLATPLSYLLPGAVAGLLVAVAVFLADELGTSGTLGFTGPQIALVVGLAIGIPTVLRVQPRLHTALRLPGGDDRAALYRRVLEDALANPRPDSEHLLTELRRVCGVSPGVDEMLRRSLSGGARPILAAGALLGGRYRAERPTARGAGSTVWRGHDERLDRAVALKPLPPGPALEVAALTRLQSPGIVAVYDVVEAAQGPVLVEEWAEGPDLQSRLREGPLAPEEAAELGRRLAEALAAVHEAGVVHGDVKPENILLTDRGAKLADFGAARLDVTRTQGPGFAFSGTPRYLPPETRNEGTHGPAVDVWGLSLVILESVQGSAAVDDPRRGLASLERRAPKLARVLAAALEPEPARRMREAARLRDELAAVHAR